jgi:hypothetical protein
LSDTYEGKAHDKSLADLVGYTLPAGSCLYQDLGFQGFVLTGSPSSNPRKSPAGANSLHQRKPLIVGSRRSESGWNTRLVG